MNEDIDFQTIVRGLRSDGRFAIHHSIFDEYAHQIGPYALAVYAALVMHADDTPPPSSRALAQELGVSRPTILRAIRVLKFYGLIPGELQKAPQPNPEGARTPSWKAVVREALVMKHGAVCQYCHQPGTSTHGPDKKPWHIEHISPRSKGGRDTWDNVTLACGSCNIRKGAG